MDKETGNLFENIPGEMPDELVEVLASGSGSVRIERIVSRGQASPPGFWYDQAATEWVVLLRGSAELRFEKTDALTQLQAGDWIEIPAHCRHRVEGTSDAGDTVWLAVHWE